MQITPKNNINFCAKLYPYPNTITNKQVFKLFEERTSKYPDLILQQNDISYFKNDYFRLYNEHKPNILSHGYFSYTNNHPKTMDNIIDRLVEIFETLKNNPLPKMHIDNM
jgi:hypothetical protein